MKDIFLIGLLMLLSSCGFYHSITEAVEHPESSKQTLGQKLPDPPDGFEWKKIDDSTFLQPCGWNAHDMQEDMGGISFYTYAASPEDFSTTKPFRTGLTVQTLHSTGRTYNTSADDMAVLYLAPYINAIENGEAEAITFEKGQQGDFKTTLLRYMQLPSSQVTDVPTVIVHKYCVADMVQGSVYIFTFESPNNHWKKAWENYGTLFFANIKMGMTP